MRISINDVTIIITKFVVSMLMTSTMLALWFGIRLELNFANDLVLR